MNKRWNHRPEGANWGDFGEDDQVGRLNFLTREKVLQGIQEVREGLTFCLSLPLDYPGGNALNPNRHPPILRPTLRHGKVNFNFQYHQIEEGRPDVLSDDLAILHLQYSTQWDALAHAGAMFDVMGDGIPRPVYYNGYAADTDITGPDDPEDAGINLHDRSGSTSSAHALSIDNMAARSVQGRGVMIDLRAHFGDERRLVSYDDLMRVIEKDRVEIEKGDMVCLHTGLAERILSMNKMPDPEQLAKLCCVLDGTDSQLLNWITDSNLATLSADNYAVEAFPAARGDG